MNQTWTDENTELLRELWREGFSAAEIAKRIGGVSRNAVIGKVHRLKLDVHPNAPLVEGNRHPAAPKRISSNKGNRHIKLNKSVNPHPVEERPAPIPAPRLLELSLLELENHNCRWPAGDRAPFTFCGHRVDDGEVYCTYHCRVAYVPRELRVKRAA
ncbi:MAG: GcrA family cell cycle regulator [Rhizobium sp.]|nr:GcrA family cell cycle regulator [Rhizobium sp.]MBW8321143.1 GcrA family cell cycle regulator [Rhizobium sp.]MBW8447897.1 GcrA family cell cycle regulator [Arenimonas sp.]